MQFQQEVLETPYKGKKKEDKKSNGGYLTIKSRKK